MPVCFSLLVLEVAGVLLTEVMAVVDGCRLESGSESTFGSSVGGDLEGIGRFFGLGVVTVSEEAASSRIASLAGGSLGISRD